MTTNYTKIPGRQRRVLDTAVALPVLKFFIDNPEEEASYEDLRLKFETPSTGANWVAGRTAVHRLMKLGLISHCGQVPGAGRSGRTAMVYCAGPELEAWANTEHGRGSLDMLERWRKGDTRRRLPKLKAQRAAAAGTAGQRVEVVGVEL